MCFQTIKKYTKKTKKYILASDWTKAALYLHFSSSRDIIDAFLGLDKLYQESSQTFHQGSVYQESKLLERKGTLWTQVTRKGKFGVHL